MWQNERLQLNKSLQALQSDYRHTEYHNDNEVKLTIASIFNYSGAPGDQFTANYVNDFF
jgi:hypothetical protein